MVNSDARRPDPHSIGSPADFAAALTALRVQAGLSIRELTAALDKETGLSVAASTLGGWFGGSHLPTRKLVALLPALLTACGATDPAEHDEWVAALNRVRRLPGPRPIDSLTPFRGLATYEPEHAEFFCGRDALTAELVDLVGKPGPWRGPLVVVGPSGSGKSSLLRAGLIASLADRYHCQLFTPGDTPPARLARQVAALVGRSAEQFALDLTADPAGSGGRVRAAVATGNRSRGLVLVVDQFEEIFTACDDERHRQVFVEALSAMTEGDDGIRVVLGMRADFYPHALLLPRLQESLRRASFVVAPMTEAEIREAITEPARRATLTLEPGLVEILLRDAATTSIGLADGAAHNAVTLPLLSYALLATCRQARGRTLTVEHYRATGGIRGAVSGSAEDAFSQLDTPRQREIARRLFLRLVHVSTDTTNTRRRVRHEEILAGRSATEVVDIRRVLDQFLAARLISADADTVEITHEALLSAWQRLRDWLSADQSGQRVSRRLSVAAATWRESGRDPDLLYRGGQLQIARDWVEESDSRSHLTPSETDFLDTSAARQLDEQRNARRRVRRRYQLLSTVIALVLIAAGVTTYARQQQVNAERERAAAAQENTQALSRFVADESDRLRGQDVPLAMELALAAYRIAPTAEARSSLLNSTAVPSATRLIPPSGPAGVVTATRNGSVVAVGTGNGTVELRTVTAAGRLTPAGPALTGGRGPISALAFNGDGHVLVAATGSGLIRVWDTSVPTRPRALAPLAGLTSVALAVAISADGDIVVAGDTAGRVAEWDLAEPGAAVILANTGLPVRAIAFTPNGRTTAVGGDDQRVSMWRLSDPAHPVPMGALSGPNSRIFAIAISPDGRYLAAGTSAQHNVFLWDISDPSYPTAAGLPLGGPASWVNSVAFSPDGRTLAVGSSDNLLWLFDTGSHRVIAQLPHPHPIDSVAFPDADSVITATDDGVVRTWHLPGPVIPGARDSVFALSFDASGRKLGVGPGSEDNTLTVWNATNPQDPLQVGAALVNTTDQSAFSGSGALTPNGDTFAVGAENGSTQLWDISDPAHPRRIGMPMPASGGLVESVTVSENGRLLAVSSDDGSAHLYDISDPARPVALAQLTVPGSGSVYQTAFDPDTHLAAVAAINNEVYLWNIRQPTTPVLLATVGGFSSSAYSVAFSRDGRLLAAGSADDTVRLWSVDRSGRLRSLGGPLNGPVGYIYALSFNPDMNELAVGSTDDTVWLWDLNEPEHPVHLATLTGPTKGVLATAFSPDGRTLAASGHDPTVRLWDIDPVSAATWICATAGTPITTAEWSKYVPGPPYDPPCR